MKVIQVGKIGTGTKIHWFTKSTIGYVPICCCGMFYDEIAGDKECPDGENTKEGKLEDVTCIKCKTLLRKAFDKRIHSNK